MAFDWLSLFPSSISVRFATIVVIFQLSLKDLQNDLFVFIYIFIVLGMGAPLEPLFLSTIASFGEHLYLYVVLFTHPVFIH